MKINDSWRYNEGIEDIKKELKINESKVEDEDDEGEGIEEDKKKIKIQIVNLLNTISGWWRWRKCWRWRGWWRWNCWGWLR